MKAKIFFADERVKDSFAALKASRRNEDRGLAALLDRAFDALSENAFCGVQIPNRSRRHTGVNSHRCAISGNTTSPIRGG